MISTDTNFIVSFPGLGINDVTINRVAFTLFGVEVYWYGLLIASAVILGLLLAYRSAPKYGIKSDHVLDTMIGIVPAMIIFARIYYVIFEWDEFRDRPLSVFNLRTGGLGFYGGVIGGIIAILIVTGIRKISLSRMMDLLCVYVPLGQGIGRWGNFFNQEAFGYNTDLPWGMKSDGTYDYLLRTGIGDPNLPVHPTFLYEFLANMLIFAALLFIRRKSVRPYVTTAWYLLLYGIVRFFVESLRTDSLYILNTGLRASMVLSAVMVLVSAGFIIFMQTRPVVPGKAGRVEIDGPPKE
ncbi:prolipoprotein diacylglyceryl transferase [Candidatus Nomurabacteria bacterium]|nr:prolipoprotein diacylglyceryl transferase [Candidatus Nomurabacteria bacterium]